MIIIIDVISILFTKNGVYISPVEYGIAVSEELILLCYKPVLSHYITHYI